MKKIQKKISLEQFKSRMPGIIDSYIDNSYECKVEEVDDTKCEESNEAETEDNADLETYVDASGEGEENDNANDCVWTFDINYRNGVSYTNYGLIPKSIKLDCKTVSYNTLVNWYHFIEFYAELLSINLSCGEIKYRNAVEYYNVEKQPNYKLRECEEFDEKFQTIFAKFQNTLSDLENNNDDSDDVENSADTEGGESCKGKEVVKLYSYLTKTYFPKYVIEDEYKDAWNKSYLSLAEVHEWIKWFEDRNYLSGNTRDCSASHDCCDCEKYTKLGGSVTCDKLKQFISRIEKPSGLTDAYATIPIILSTTIDDMGEYSIFYEEWVPGHDYGNQGHIVVNYDGESYILKEEKFGSSYNSYKELEFEFDDWEKRGINFQKACGDGDLENTDDNPLENCSVGKYAYNHDGKLCIDGDINIKNMSRSYNIHTNYEGNEDLGFYVIKGVPYRCNKINVVRVKDKLYQDDKLYQVYYDYENNPYITIGKKNYYGLYDYNANNYTFNFKNIHNLTITRANVVIVDNSIYEVKKETFNGVDKCTIKANGVIYNKIHAYSVINGNRIYFNDNYKVIVPYKDGNEIKYEENVHVLGPKILDDYDLQDDPNGVTSGFAYCVSDSGDILYVHQKDYVIYDNTLLSGTTESKLSCFLSSNLEVDNIGNKLPGLLQESNKNKSWLTLPYKPKTIVHITTENDDKVWCDYLESITFYYSDSFGNKVEKIEYEDDLDISSVESKLKEKLSMSTSGDTFGSEHFLVSDLKCEFKYHMGCVIISKKNADGTYDYSIEDGNNGVTYYDNVTLVKKQCEFYLNNTSFYMMNYYDMVFETKNYTDDTYGHNVTVPIAKFSCKMNSFDNDNYVNFPLIREEYKLGSSSHEKIESDIYINRGTARAIDNHIKLMEVRSLESLEQYGNGYFKIIKN